ncbi:ParB/RepB/Spo0J family partition protein [Bacteroides fragilis]|jgi:ParB family chromosome partitioning protein|uniref:ParB/RepB/Spo0J family partition protein n=1 Tax=Bacteroides fragilis TaxID=817 RepID=UPI002454DCA7|nr:ParB/RepB/Spo0J family partition protein [Bacteroides fragilis]
MKATVNQSAAERNITLVALANIQPGSFNPRKHFDEANLYELAESIKQQGVLQPITVRPIAGTDRYEIVFGERRYRASVMAEMEEIPVIVSELTDEVAEEMAITENLQRKDVTPIEEAAAYQRLIESGRHTVQTLAVLFGKNENYIRTRLKFTALIPEIATLLESDELTISVATEICRYGEDIQKEVYEKHLQDGNAYNSWRGLKAADVAKRIENNYTTDLRYYSFDKTECATCAHNTNNLLLFCDGGCGHCANRTCLAEMNASFLMEKAVQIMQRNPNVSLCRDRYTTNDTVIERLIALGYEVENLETYTAFPNSPQEPKAENFNDIEKYGEARTRYEQQWADYMEKEEEITRRSEAGEITVYAKIGQKEIVFCYVENVTEQAADGTAVQAPLSPVEKLQKQDERNKEIALEKTVEDTKRQIMEADITGGKFGADEEKILYFFMLSNLREEHFTAVGITEEGKHYLTDEDKMNIVSNLTVKIKTIIRRDYLIANFRNAYGKNTVASLLLDFARKHMPEELSAIESGYNEVYEKRHQRIEERKAVLLVQEKTKAKGHEITQPEEQQQPEGIAA